MQSAVIQTKSSIDAARPREAWRVRKGRTVFARSAGGRIASTDSAEPGMAHLAELSQTAERAGKQFESVLRSLNAARSTPAVHPAHAPFDSGLRLLTLAAVTGVFVTLL